MAMAGYDPSRSIEFWENLSQNAGAKPPEFLSTTLPTKRGSAASKLPFRRPLSIMSRNGDVPQAVAPGEHLTDRKGTKLK